jgi:hypothetical protein
MMWRYLPRAQSRLLAVAAALIAAFYVALAVGFALQVMARPVVPDERRRIGRAPGPGHDPVDQQHFMAT